MLAKEKELYELIGKNNIALEKALARVAKIKKDLDKAETAVVNAKIEKEKLAEELERLQSHIPRHELTFNQKEANEFREKFPELCDWAKKRDEK